MVPTCSRGGNTLSGTMAFRYIHGPGLILSTLARAEIRYPKLTPVDRIAARRTRMYHHPQLKILQTWKLRRHRCRCKQSLGAREPGRGDESICLRSHHASPCRFPAHPDPYRGGRAAQVAQDEPRNSLHAGPELEHSMAGLTFRLAHLGFQGSRLIS